jgi:hypothetical protein
MNHGRVRDDHIVDNARSCPASPPGSVDEAGSSPPWHKGFTPSERHPANDRSTDPDADADTRLTVKGHQGRRIHRPSHNRARCPDPNIIHEDPPTVMVGCPPPGGGVHPCPTIIRIAHPRTGAVRHPIRRNVGRHPYPAIGGHCSPCAMLVQIAQTVSLSRDITCALGIQMTIGAGVIPAIPTVRRRCRHRCHLRALFARNRHRLIGSHRQCFTIGQYRTGFCASARDEGCAFGVGRNAIISFGMEGESRSRGVDHNHVPRVDGTQI